MHRFSERKITGNAQIDDDLLQDAIEAALWRKNAGTFQSIEDVAFSEIPPLL
jgi:hypothetical protein